MSEKSEIIDLNIGERYSFYKLFNTNKLNIKVPMIQRDYAQGRKTKKNVRHRFLDALYNYLADGKPNRDLDFIYGSIEQDNSTGSRDFIPLDGQQRLTTLFLLHWYLAIISGNHKEYQTLMSFKNSDEDDNEYSSSRFKYQLRTSSTDFCDALLNNIHEIGDNILMEGDKSLSPSECIKRYNWFYKSWEYDPSVKGMLVVLDDIHEKFRDKSEFFQLLFDEEKPIITFLFLDLPRFKLTDELYVKMNARGKQLTSFEQLKADFEKHLKTLAESANKEYTLDHIVNDEKVKQKVTIQKYFSWKMDTDWINLLWQYHDRKKTSEFITLDMKLMNFIRIIFTFQYINGIKKSNKNLEMLLGTNVGKALPNYTDELSFLDYVRYKVLDDSQKSDLVMFSSLIECFDILENGDNKIKNYFDKSHPVKEEQLFKKVLAFNLNNAELVLFYAYIRFLQLNHHNTDAFSEWMRVIYNLATNTIIDDSQSVHQAIRSIENLLQNASLDILDYLIQYEVNILFFSEWQVKEEKIKAILMKSYSKQRWPSIIKSAEANSFFKGQIGFLLEFSGIEKYFDENNNFDWNESVDKKYFNLLQTYIQKAGPVFAALKSKGSKGLNCLWERAVLSKGDYLPILSYDRYSFLNSNWKNRDYSWKRLLRWEINDKSKEKRWGSIQYVKEVFDDSRVKVEDPLRSLEEVAADSVNDWREDFLREPRLMAFCDYGLINFDENENITLFRKSKKNHRKARLETYQLYLKLEDLALNITPFKRLWIYEASASEDFSCAVIDRWDFRDKRYAMDMYYRTKHKSYYIKFYNCEDKRISNTIQKILNSFNFIKKKGEGPYLQFSTENKTLNGVKKLVKEFNKLNKLEAQRGSGYAN